MLLFYIMCLLLMYEVFFFFSLSECQLWGSSGTEHNDNDSSGLLSAFCGLGTITWSLYRDRRGEALRGEGACPSAMAGSGETGRAAQAGWVGAEVKGSLLPLQVCPPHWKRWAPPGDPHGLWHPKDGGHGAVSVERRGSRNRFG